MISQLKAFHEYFPSDFQNKRVWNPDLTFEWKKDTGLESEGGWKNNLKITSPY